MNYGDSEELSKTLSSIVTGAVAKDGAAGASRFSSFAGPSDNPIFSAEVKITSDKNNNALVVTASPTDWLTLKDVIGRLDIPRDQVYVEGMILEANVEKNKSFGVEFLAAYGPGNAQRAGFTSTNTNLLKLLATGVPTSVGGLVGGFGVGPTTTITPPGGTPQTVNAVNALITAIASHGSTNVLATPQILVLDNTEATFEVGDTVPITNSTVATGGVQAFSTVDQEAKLSLKITPQINKVTRFVKLKINQKIDDFKSDPNPVAGKGLPKATRTAITEVMVRDRDTIAMGGLLREVERVQNAKVPLLGDIPVLGWLFKSRSKTTTKVNLLFFITPKILAPYAKTASENTKQVLARREKGMKDMFEDDEVDPNAKGTQVLNSKLDRQIEGPLYDMSDADHYKNLNNENVGPDENAIEDEEEIETPNYQEIRNKLNK